MFLNGNALVEKEGNPLFDVTSESYDKTEVCELTSLFLSKLVTLIGTKNVGLYRDDGLAVIHQANRPKIDRIRKTVITRFKSEELSVSIDKNWIGRDFPEVSFNLEMDKFFPCSKPNNTPLYIHSESGLSLSFIKELPSLTNRRISNLSCDKDEFNKPKPIYESAL